MSPLRPPRVAVVLALVCVGVGVGLAALFLSRQRSVSDEDLLRRFNDHRSEFDRLASQAQTDQLGSQGFCLRGPNARSRSGDVRAIAQFDMYELLLTRSGVECAVATDAGVLLYVGYEGLSSEHAAKKGYARLRQPPELVAVTLDRNPGELELTVGGEGTASRVLRPGEVVFRQVEDGWYLFRRAAP